MISIRQLNKSFGKLKVLDSVSLGLREGEAVSLIGPNGSGKTTLIKCILGMVLPDNGDITVSGTKIRNNWKYRQVIGYMPQTGRYPDNMTVRQLFDMMLDIRKTRKADADCELYDAFRLGEISNKRLSTLSGGTRQKVSASLAFLFRPEILILDEPTAGLDPLSSETLKDKIRREKECGRLILITSHILSDLDDLVTEVIYLNEGRIMFHKSLDQLRSDTNEERLSRAIASIMKSKEPTYA